jgi:short-subunit dehydrogenase
LAGQRALVTGASSGIGKELARILAAEGANLVITARRAERLEALAAEIKQAHGVDVRVEALDLGDPAAPLQLFERTEGAGVAIDVLVNNAGFGDWRDFVDTPWERYQGMLQLNVTALTELTHRFLPAMIERKHGHVMNVASTGAYVPCPSFAVYAATKAYVRNMTEALDYELKGSGVRAISVCPGGTKTEFIEQAGQKLKGSAEPFMMTAERCAQIAVAKMLAGRRNVVTGFINWLSMLLLRFLPIPRSLYPWIAYKSMAANVDSAPVPALAVDTSAPPEPAAKAESAPPEGTRESET